MTVEKYKPSEVLPSLILTESALAHFKKSIEEKEKSGSVCIGIKFDVSKTGCSGYSYQSELVGEGDISPSDLKIENIKNLNIWMSEKAKPLINGVIVDYQKLSLGQSKLIYTNPNETARCGCGVSFSVSPAMSEKK